jgi:hypothetical protein
MNWCTILAIERLSFMLHDRCQATSVSELKVSFAYPTTPLAQDVWTGVDGWADQQLPDGTMIWTSPSGDTYVTMPGSALLFPSLCAPTGALPAPDAPAEPCIHRVATMPLRRRTRAQNLADRVTAERRINDQSRQDRQAEMAGYFGAAAPADDGEPPPF